MFIKKTPFYEADGVGGAGGTNNSEPEEKKQQQAPDIDYDKLASLISGKQKVAEDTVLKSYLKQQGLSGDELNQAITTFKEEKVKNQPDVSAIQSQLTKAQQIAQQASIEKEATLEAISLGVDVKSIPYLLRMADLGNVIGDNGKVNQETVKAALTKVLEDIPALKKSAEENKGFHIGGDSGNGQGGTNNDEIRRLFGLKAKA